MNSVPLPWVINCEAFYLHVVSSFSIEFVSDRLSYIVLKGRWLHIIVVNVHAPSEEKVRR